MAMVVALPDGAGEPYHTYTPPRGHGRPLENRSCRVARPRSVGVGNDSRPTTRSIQRAALNLTLEDDAWSAPAALKGGVTEYTFGNTCPNPTSNQTPTARDRCRANPLELFGYPSSVFYDCGPRGDSFG